MQAQLRPDGMWEGLEGPLRLREVLPSLQDIGPDGPRAADHPDFSTLPRTVSEEVPEERRVLVVRQKEQQSLVVLEA